MAGRRRSNGFDLLTEVRVTQIDMQKDIKEIKQQFQSLYSVDPPGPIVKLNTHLRDHNKAKWTERTIFTLLAGAAGTVASYLWELIFRK